MNFKIGDIITSTITDETDFFYKAAILLNQKSELGIYGLLLNQKLDIHFNQLFSACTIKNIPIYNGGPVGADEISFLHCLPNYFPEANKINEQLYWGGYLSKLINALNSGLIASDQIKIFKGYCGWDWELFETEAKQNDWILSETVISL
jgi:putative transcriptional regulator